MIRASPLLTTYGAPVDRVWAYELLRGKPASTQPAPGAAHAPPAGRGGIDANDWGNHGGGQTQRRPAPQLRESAPAPHQESGGGLFGGPGEILTGSTGRRGPQRRGDRSGHQQRRTRQGQQRRRWDRQPDPARDAGVDTWGTALKQGGLTPKIEVCPPLLASMSIARYHHHYRLHGWWVSIYPRTDTPVFGWRAMDLAFA
jgi:hypothetical protein